MKDRIIQDLKDAMKAQDKEKLAVIRMVKGAISLEEINSKKELNDNEIISIIAKQIKTRKESIEDFKKGNRQDLIDQANSEIEILNEYMPEQLSIDKINNIIDEIFKEVNPTSMADMGKLMNLAKEKLNGRADMGYVSKTIKEKLSK